MQALAKIGEELYLEPKPEGLALRTMNSSRSAVMSFKFDRHFFDYYEEKSEDDLQRIPDNTNPETSSQNPSKCRLMMRSILMVFNRLNVLVMYNFGMFCPKKKIKKNRQSHIMIVISIALNEKYVLCK